MNRTTLHIGAEADLLEAAAFNKRLASYLAPSGWRRLPRSDRRAWAIDLDRHAETMRRIADQLNEAHLTRQQPPFENPQIGHGDLAC
jgi:hypothetical protein